MLTRIAVVVALVLLVALPALTTTTGPPAGLSLKNREFLKEGPTATQLSAEELYKTASPAVVRIRAGTHSGTGFLIGDGNEIVTCYHVVAGASAITIDGSDAIVHTIKYDPVADVAILGVSKRLGIALVLSKQRPSVGSQVFLIGNPLGLDRTMSVGIISGVRQRTSSTLLQTTASASPGSSGSPALDVRGQVIGVLLSTIEAGQNINFLIPVNQIEMTQDFGSVITTEAIKTARQALSKYWQSIDHFRLESTKVPLSLRDSLFLLRKTDPEQFHDLIQQSIDEADVERLMAIGVTLSALHLETILADSASWVTDSNKGWWHMSPEQLQSLLTSMSYPATNAALGFLDLNEDTLLEPRLAQFWLKAFETSVTEYINSTPYSLLVTKIRDSHSRIAFHRMNRICTSVMPRVDRGLAIEALKNAKARLRAAFPKSELVAFPINLALCALGVDEGISAMLLSWEEEMEQAKAASWVPDLDLWSSLVSSGSGKALNEVLSFVEQGVERERLSDMPYLLLGRISGALARLSDPQIAIRLLQLVDTMLERNEKFRLEAPQFASAIGSIAVRCSEGSVHTVLDWCTERAASGKTMVLELVMVTVAEVALRQGVSDLLRQRVLRILQLGMSDKSARVRRIAIRGLRRLGTKEAIEELRGNLTEVDDDLLNLIISALGECGDRSDLARIEDTINSRNVPERVWRRSIRTLLRRIDAVPKDSLVGGRSPVRPELGGNPNLLLG